MNNNPRIAAAAINTASSAAEVNTALFHIGSKPRRTPEKMKPGSVAANRFRGNDMLPAFAPFCHRRPTAEASVSLCDSGTASRSEGSSDTVFVAVSGTAFRSAVIASLEPVSEIETF